MSLSFRVLVSVATALAIAACGGGGGGGGGSGGGSTPTQNVSLSTQRLTFTAASSSDSVPAQSVTATVNGVSDGTLYFLISWSGNAIASVSNVVITSATTGSATVTPVSPGTLGPGTHTSIITVRACLNDPTCNTGQLAGSPMTIEVVYQIDGFAISPAIVNLSAVEGIAPTPQDLTLSRPQSPGTAWATSTSYGANGGSWLSVSPTTATSLPATLRFSASPQFAGTYSATTTITGSDGKSVPIPVTYVVLPKIALGATAASFSAVTGQATLPAASTINVSAPGSETGYWTAVYYTTGNPTGWLDVTGSSVPGTLAIAPNTTNLAPGTYHAGVQLNPQSNGTAVNVDVTYTVASASLTSSPATISWSGVAGVSQALSQVLSLSTNLGSTAWTRAITYDSGPSSGWLNVPASGNTSTGATIGASTAGLAAGTYRAHVTISAGGATAVVPITLLMKTPGVEFVSPYVGTSGVAGNVVIRGNGLTGASQVSFGSNPATSFSVISDTEIRASYPALSAGSYQVNVDSLGAHANLVVVDAPAFAYAAVARPEGASGVRTLLYDAERKAIYLVQDNWRANDRIERFRISAGSWVADVTPSFNSYGTRNLNSTIVLSPNGTEILKTNSTSISHVSTSSFLETTHTSALPALGNGIGLNLLAMSNDGKAVGNANGGTQSEWILYRYDVLDRQFSLLATPIGMSDPMNRMLSACADGSRILLAPFAWPATSMFQYSAGDGSMATTPVMTASAQRVAQSRNGAISIVDTATNQHSVYDAAFQLLGTLPSLTQYALSPNGQRVYTFVAGPPATIHVYDLTAPTGGSFAEIGSGTSLPDSPGSGVDMVVTPDGGSLIIVGDQRAIVMPAP